jgi:hypothetical protein
MDNEMYFRSITDEINAVQDRVRNFIASHWLSDGEWKESVLRTILRRHLPKNIGIGTGFIVSENRTSTQIDILLYDNNKPLLFQDDAFVIVTPDCVRGIIEIKTTAKRSELENIFTKIADNIQLVSKGHRGEQFFGVFFYKADDTLNGLGLNGGNVSDVLENLFRAALISTAGDETIISPRRMAPTSSPHRVINCVSIGDSFFSRFWFESPEGAGQIDRWHAYDLTDKAPAYFIHNVIEHLCSESVLRNNAIWYPESGKESRKIGERNLRVASDEDW